MAVTVRCGGFRRGGVSAELGGLVWDLALADPVLGLAVGEDLAEVAADRLGAHPCLVAVAQPLAKQAARSGDGRSGSRSTQRRADGGSERDAGPKPASANVTATSTRRTRPGATQASVLSALQGADAMTAGQMAANTGLGRGTVSTTLSKLVKSGRVEKAELGYRLPAAEANA